MDDSKKRKLRNLNTRWELLKDQRICLKRDMGKAKEAGDDAQLEQILDKMDDHLKLEEAVAKEIAKIASEP